MTALDYGEFAYDVSMPWDILISVLAGEQYRPANRCPNRSQGVLPNARGAR